MPKKIVILLVAIACLSLACICIPEELFSIIEYNIEYYLTEEPYVDETYDEPTVDQPSDQADNSEPQIVPDDLQYTGDLPACISNLEDVLYEAENVSRPGEELDSEYILVTYPVSGDSLGEPDYAAVLPNVAENQYGDDSNYRAIWDFIIDIIPADQRTLISNFVVYTDGVGGSLGAVEQTEDPHLWMLEMDSEDSAYFPELSTTLVHEFAHLLTLNDAQVTTDYDVFYNPDDEYAYNSAEASCDTYFLFEGCSNDNSYMTAFYDQFWSSFYDEWLEINYIEDENAYEDQLDAFYQNYADQFVSSYAVTSPEEDIAESFMYFIFVAVPDGYSISDQKILFFYDYPELVTLRDRILARLCAYVE